MLELVCDSSYSKRLRGGVCQGQLRLQSGSPQIMYIFKVNFINLGVLKLKTVISNYIIIKESKTDFIVSEDWLLQVDI